MWKYKQFCDEAQVCHFLNSNHFEPGEFHISHTGDYYTVFYKKTI